MAVRPPLPPHYLQRALLIGILQTQCWLGNRVYKMDSIWRTFGLERADDGWRKWLPITAFSFLPSTAMEPRKREKEQVLMPQIMLVVIHRAQSMPPLSALYP